MVTRTEPAFDFERRGDRTFIDGASGAGFPRAVEFEAAVDRLEERVVVARDLLVDPLLEPDAPHPRVEGLVRLDEVEARAPVAEVVEDDVPTARDHNGLPTAS